MTDELVVRFVADKLGYEFNPENGSGWVCRDGLSLIDPLTDGNLMLLGMVAARAECVIVDIYPDNVIVSNDRREIQSEEFNDTRDIPRAFWSAWYGLDN